MTQGVVVRFVNSMPSLSTVVSLRDVEYIKIGLMIYNDFLFFNISLISVVQIIYILLFLIKILRY
jgi:hypothetical protein